MKTKTPRPIVRWYRTEDRKRSPKHREIKKYVNQLLIEVWKRIPPSAKTVICRSKYYEGEVLLHMKPPGVELDWPLSNPDAGGVWNNGSVHIRVYGIDRRLKSQRNSLIWTLAHEFAHGYWSSIGQFAEVGWCHETEHMEEDEKLGFGPFGALTPYNGVGDHPDCFDRGKTTYDGSTGERLADAVAIAWGFGYEIAHSLAASKKSYKEISDYNHNYLEPDILEMHRILATKSD